MIKTAISFILFFAGIAVSAQEIDIKVESAFVRGMPPGRTVTAAFFNVINRGTTECILNGIETPVAERAEIHSHLHENGVMKMRQIDSVEIPAGETANFKPGGLHIMLFGVQPLADDTSVALTLEFENCGSLPVQARVRSVRD